MRIVTWNINGLRAVTRRGVGDLVTLLDSLHADIVCFQETKLTRAELDRDLALIEGWDSYFSHCKDRSYSGVATYCRKAVTVPVAAEAGFTGALQGSSTDQRDFPRQIPGCYDELCNRFTQEELLAIDLEGRCVITDHESFILFNLYGPAITSEENAADRFAYKMRLYQALQCRMEACLAAGRSVILLGDLNICPQPIDSCDPGDLTKFRDRADKQWLSSIMKHNGGSFVDLFRHFHPNREEVYSCWSTASGARVNNYGARIDLILLAEPGTAATALKLQGGSTDSQQQLSNVANPVLRPAASDQLISAKQESSLLEQCQDCGVWMDMQGSDHAPVWGDWKLGGPLPTPEAAPPLSTRYMFTGKQRKLTAWLGSLSADSSQSQPALSSHDINTEMLQTSNTDKTTFAASSPKLPQASSLSTVSGKDIAASVRQPPVSLTRKGSGARAGASKRGAKVGQTSLKSFMQRSPAASVNAASASTAIMQRPFAAATVTASALDPGDSTSALVGLLETAPVGPSAPQEESDSRGQFGSGAAAEPPVAESSATQLLHQPALQRSSQQSDLDAAQQDPDQHAQPAADSRQKRCHAAISAGLQAEHLGHATNRTSSAALLETGDATGINTLSGPASSAQRDASDSSECLIADVGKAAATAAWSKIHSKMKAPKCKGHNEDCVIREVKKNGPNKGRLFYVCRRPDGKPPQGRCDHFEWVGNRTTRGQSNASVPSSNKRLTGA